jgi:diamine N-acetyltransferase
MELLENNYIRLRAPEPEDLGLLYDWENDPELWESAATPAPYSRFELKQYIAEQDGDLYRRRQIRFIIEIKELRAAVGAIDLYDFEPFHRRAAVGVIVSPAHQRRRIATQALELLVQYAFGFVHIHQLYAHIAADNIPSLRLFERCEFRTVALLNDWILTSEGFADVKILARINPAL